jgi:Uma2 family endonuclease
MEITHPSPELIAWRRKTGADLFDEVWDGLLHMNPAPSLEHNRLLGDLYRALSAYLESRGLGRIYPTSNVSAPGVSDWTRNFRVPDLSIVFDDQTAQLCDVYIEGGPRVIVEIRSPGDETSDKLEFYARIGTSELIVIDSVTKRIETFRASEGRLVPAPPDADGWHRSGALDGELATRGGRIELRRVGSAIAFASV